MVPQQKDAHAVYLVHHNVMRIGEKGIEVDDDNGVIWLRKRNSRPARCSA